MLFGTSLFCGIDPILRVRSGRKAGPTRPPTLQKQSVHKTWRGYSEVFSGRRRGGRSCMRPRTGFKAKSRFWENHVKSWSGSRLFDLRRNRIPQGLVPKFQDSPATEHSKALEAEIITSNIMLRSICGIS